MQRTKRTLALAAALLFLACAARAPEARAQNASAGVASARKKSPPRNLAIFVFDGVQIIDYTGPYEVFGHAYGDGQPLFNIYTVAEKPDAVTTAMGMTVVPKYSFETMPKADVLVVPGGDTRQQMENPKVIKWVQETAAGAEYVLSVCNGAFYLGKAGLLDGLTATTTASLLDRLKEIAPKAKVVGDRRFADNGKIITAGGLSSGIDGALHLVERIQGRGRAQEIALGIEYNWQPDLNYARASHADRHLRKVIGREGFKLPEGTGWNVLWQQGGRDDWQKDWEVRLDGTASDLLKIIDAKLAEGWTRLPAAKAGSATQTHWKFTDDEGRTWNAVSRVAPAQGEGGAYKLTIKLARADSPARASLE